MPHRILATWPHAGAPMKRDVFCIEQRLPGETTWEAVPGVLELRRWRAVSEKSVCIEAWAEHPKAERPTFRVAVYRAVAK